LDAFVQIKSASSAIQAFCVLVGFSFSICSTIFVAGVIFVHRRKATLGSSKIIILIENVRAVARRNTLTSFNLSEKPPNKMLNKPIGVVIKQANNRSPKKPVTISILHTSLLLHSVLLFLGCSQERFDPQSKQTLYSIAMDWHTGLSDVACQVRQKGQSVDERPTSEVPGSNQ